MTNAHTHGDKIFVVNLFLFLKKSLIECAIKIFEKIMFVIKGEGGILLSFFASAMPVRLHN